MSAPGDTVVEVGGLTKRYGYRLTAVDDGSPSVRRAARAARTARRRDVACGGDEVGISPVAASAQCAPAPVSDRTSTSANFSSSRSLDR